MKKKISMVVILLALVSLACNLSSQSASPVASPQPGQPAVPVSPGQAPSNQPAAQGTPPAAPVSIYQGLNSLNSYVMTVTLKNVDPDPKISSETTVQTQYSKDLDATYTKISATSYDESSGGTKTNDNETYSIGNDQCSGSDSDWSWTSYTAQETEMLGLVKSMIGFTPLIDNPQFVGQETVNDLPVNHFSFKVPNLGVKSGVEVKTNQGDYWLAVDGQYIVKYTLILETSSSADAKVLHEEVTIDLTNVNQPVSIAFPQACLDASQATPEP